MHLLDPSLIVETSYVLGNGSWMHIKCLIYYTFTQEMFISKTACCIY
jgi:hypothetical protein